jgi:hypothetical protein
MASGPPPESEAPMESESSLESKLPMKSTPPLPESFQAALSNKADSEKLEELCDRSTHPPVFVYGSLMLPSVIGGVIGREEKRMAQTMIPARLDNHRRYCVKWADFPAIIRTVKGVKAEEPTVNAEGPIDNAEDPAVKAEESVDGMLVFGLRTSERKHLDRFESGLYSLEKVEVFLTLSDGTSTSVVAEVYIWGGERHELEEPEVKKWTIEGFLTSSFYGVLKS